MENGAGEGEVEAVERVVPWDESREVLVRVVGGNPTLPALSDRTAAGGETEVEGLGPNPNMARKALLSLPLDDSTGGEDDVRKGVNRALRPVPGGGILERSLLGSGSGDFSSSRSSGPLGLPTRGWAFWGGGKLKSSECFGVDPAPGPSSRGRLLSLS